MVLARLAPESPVSVMLTSAVAADAVLVPWRPILLQSPDVTLLALRHQ